MSIDGTFASWLPTDIKLEAFHMGIRQFVAKHLEPFKINDSSLIDPGGKSIVDPLIGYVHLRTWEVAFIDTNLFQRLRRIHQVGLAHLIYPTLGYKRFEHTLGVLGNAIKLSDRIRQIYLTKEFRDTSIIDVIDQYEIPLRLAALFHDIGHCAFSHVSERAFADLKGHSKYPATKYIINKYTEALGLSKLLAPAELLSIAIVSSPEIRAFANRLKIPDKSEENINQWFEAAARFIAGSPIPKQANTVFLAQILSSGLDADKLDYMQRDARLTGIPLGIDLTRIYDKLRIFKLKAAELPSGLSRLKETMPSDNPFFVLGLTHGGQFAFEEFCVARATLYDKIYLHQKVRAAEAQLHFLLSSLPKKVKRYEECHKWLYLSEDIIDHEDLPLPGDYQPDELLKSDFAGILNLKPIHLRSILKRAFAIGLRNSLSEPSLQSLKGSASPTWSFIEELKSDSKQFIESLKSEVKKIAVLTKRTISSDLLAHIEQISIDVPEHTRVQQGATSIFIKQPLTLPHKWALPVDQIAEYYRQRALSYIFAPEDVCDLVAIAAEMLIYVTYGLEFEQREFLSERVEKVIIKTKDLLSKTDYYHLTQALVPKSAFLLTAAAQEKISITVSNLQEFRSYKGDHVTPASVSGFLMQFPEGLQSVALDLLTMIKTIDPLPMVEKICKEHKQLKSKGGTNILTAPLGSMLDSASHLPYYFKNTPAMAEVDAPEFGLITDNTISSAKQLILFDDNINSGFQTLNIVAEWFAVNLPDNFKLNETHGVRLQNDSQIKLRKIPIHFVFGVGPTAAKHFLPEMLDEHLKFDKNNITVTLLEELSEDHKPLSGKNSKLRGQRVELREYLEKVGRSLLIGSGADEEAAKRRALGDSGTEGLVVFPYNVPTMTITAIWCSGEFDGRKWTPLCERRRNPKPGGEYSSENN